MPCALCPGMLGTPARRDEFDVQPGCRTGCKTSVYTRAHRGACTDAAFALASVWWLGQHWLIGRGWRSRRQRRRRRRGQRGVCRELLLATEHGVCAASVSEGDEHGARCLVTFLVHHRLQGRHMLVSALPIRHHPQSEHCKASSAAECIGVRPSKARGHEYDSLSMTVAVAPAAVATRSAHRCALGHR